MVAQEGGSTIWDEQRQRPERLYLTSRGLARELEALGEQARQHADVLVLTSSNEKRHGLSVASVRHLVRAAPHLAETEHPVCLALESRLRLRCGSSDVAQDAVASVVAPQVDQGDSPVQRRPTSGGRSQRTEPLLRATEHRSSFVVGAAAVESEPVGIFRVRPSEYANLGV